jgi:hypothetical protein
MRNKFRTQNDTEVLTAVNTNISSLIDVHRRFEERSVSIFRVSVMLNCFRLLLDLILNWEAVVPHKIKMKIN